MNNKHFCQRPFSEIEIHTDGNVYTCCPDYLKKYPIGNIFNVSSFDEIWYSEKAIELRQRILNSDYSLCNSNICNMKIDQEEVEQITHPSYPTLVRFAYDTQCNLRCMICRDSLIYNSEERNKEYDSMIDSMFLPVLKNAKIMSITSAGEITASKHSQILTKRAAEMYPNLKFEILTNGLLFNKEFCDSLGITNRIERVVISLHAMKKNTYETIMKGSNYDIVRKNLQWIFEMKKEGKISDVCLIFVACSINYKEIPEFIEYSILNDAHSTVWEYRNHNKTVMDRQFKKYAVWLKEHPKYNDFVKTINKVQLKYKDTCRMPDIFKGLKTISLFESFKYRICPNKFSK